MFLLKQLQDTFSSDTCLTFLPVIARAIIPLNTTVQNVHVAVKQLKCFTNISGSSAVTKFGVKLPLFLQFRPNRRTILLFIELTLPHKYKYRSLKFDPYITSIASKPKAHNVITYKFNPYIFSIASKPKAHYVITTFEPYITFIASKPKAHNAITYKFDPYITFIDSKQKAHNLITYKFDPSITSVASKPKTHNVITKFDPYITSTAFEDIEVV